MVSLRHARSLRGSSVKEDRIEQNKDVGVVVDVGGGGCTTYVIDALVNLHVVRGLLVRCWISWRLYRVVLFADRLDM